jgi:hypothetical protein
MSRFVEDYQPGMAVISNPTSTVDFNLDLVLKSDFDKYVDKILNRKARSDEEKQVDFNNMLEFFLDQGKDKETAEKLAHEEVYIKTTYWRPPSEKEPAYRELEGNPKEHFPLWRKSALSEEIQFKERTYSNSVLPPEKIIELETERVCEKINNSYYALLLDIMVGRLTEEYYEVAKLIGKIDYLKSLNGDLKSKLNQANSISKSITRKLTQDEIALMLVYNRESVDEGSPRKLREKYNHYHQKENRIGLEPIAHNGAQTKSINKLKKIKKIIPHLKSSEAKKWATDEANTLEANIDGEVPQK